MSTRMYRVAGIESSPPPRYGWLRALGALLGGSIIAYFGLFVFAFVLGVVVHMLPGTLPEEPGVGWPWRIDGAWSALADLGPLLLTGALVAAGVGFYVGPRVGHPTARWPIVLCATLVGWVPIAQSGRGGLLPVSGGLAFVAMWWTTRKTSEMPRWRLPAAAISPRVALTAVVAAVIALAAVSIAYSTLHPYAWRASAHPRPRPSSTARRIAFRSPSTTRVRSQYGSLPSPSRRRQA